MSDYQAIDTTPVSSPAYFQEYRDKSPTRIGHQSRFVTSQTDIVGHAVLTLNRVGLSTPTASERRFRLQDTNETFEQAGDSPFVAASESRMALLVQKYEGRSTREDNARLEILTHRIRRLSPRVTSDDLNELTVIVDEIENISASIDDLREEFGLT